ncbi:uncharacterized mitochondrial protein AtMg00810-like [Phaseolus vulgaris]|uniref:uncharacterized mitochondrial protein AtMg00810-like n=1 Tax=Phaseolus vulgaris TaxID=3885 RepID=UPI0035CB60BB
MTYQIDINNAFLHGDLSPPVSMQQPPGFSADSTLVCRLNKAIYVIGSSLFLVQDFIKQLSLYFALKDLGPLHYFLGIEVSWLKNNSIHLSQAKYIKDLIRRTNMVNSKPQPSPIFSSLRLTDDESVSVDDPTLYQSIVGALQYATITRPEISFSIN